MTQWAREFGRAEINSPQGAGQGRPESNEAPPDPYRLRAMWVPGLFAFTLILCVGVSVGSVERMTPEDPWAAAAAELGVEPVRLGQGAAVYRNTCAVCHGPDGEGLPNLGKPLRNSEYVQSHSDDELFALVANGRQPSDPENTSGVLMPPRGARGLDDDRVHAVVAYMRAMQDTSKPFASVDAWSKPIFETALADGTEAVGAAVNAVGRDLFIASCSSCHGPRGEGMEGLGKPLAGSEFVQSKNDKELSTFIKMGRPVWDPDNTTGLDMPPKGGNPAITDDQIADIITYIRSLNTN